MIRVEGNGVCVRRSHATLDAHVMNGVLNLLTDTKLTQSVET